MAATEGERLLVSLEARMTKYERDLQRAHRTTDRNFGAIERRAATAGKRMESTLAASSARVGKILGAFGRGGVVGAAFAATFGVAAQAAQKAADAVADIGAQAKKAGISFRAFQELGFVASQNRIDVDSLADGLKELQLRADEFILTGKGSAAESFQRLGYSATQLKQKLKDPSALFTEIIGKLEKLDKAAQIRIADELFGGTGGEKFVALVDQGAASIRKQIEAAHDLGIVMSDDVLEKAEIIDRQFKTVGTTISQHVKKNIIEAGYALSEFLDTFNKFENQRNKTLESRLTKLGRDRLDIENRILKLREDQDALTGATAPAERRLIDGSILALREQDAALAKEEGEILGILGRRTEELGKTNKATTPTIKDLNSALDGTGTAGSGATKGIESFADAIRSLKGEIPGLADELKRLDAEARINEVYRAAVNKARTVGEAMQAAALRDQALSALSTQGARDAAGRGMLDLIGYAEGTDKGRGYNETLGYGKFTGGNKNLTLMTLDQIDAMQSQMLRHPDNTFNSSAAGRYQIVQKTLRDLRDKLGLRGDEFFDASMQDRLAQELLRQRGNDPAGLRNEWEGLRRVDDSTIRSAYDGTSVSMPALDPAMTAKNQALKDQADAYNQILQSGRQYVAEQGTEQQALGMTAQAAAALRYEQDLLNQATQAGIELTPRQRDEIRQLAQGMAQAEAATTRMAASQDQIAQAGQWLGGQLHGLFSGLLTGSMTAEQALKRLADSLIDVLLQAALLGQGPLGGMFGGGLFAFLGFSKGGAVDAWGGLRLAGGGGVRGPGTSTSDSIPALLSDGEFVVNARQTAKHRALLEAINSGQVSRFAAGGPVGSGNPGGGWLSDRGGAPSISISAPITVEGSAGTPEQNQDLAKQMSRQLEASMRGVVADELRRSLRPGNLGNNRSRGR